MKKFFKERKELIYEILVWLYFIVVFGIIIASLIYAYISYPPNWYYIK